LSYGSVPPRNDTLTVFRVVFKGLLAINVHQRGTHGEWREGGLFRDQALRRRRRRRRLSMHRRRTQLLTPSSTITRRHH